jgi:ligand-binding sensor domain-containing protein/signal transduction histidine kinase
MDVLEAADGSLWIAAPSGLYRRWQDGRAARYTVREGLPNDYLSGLFEDHAGHLWAETRLGGFFRFVASTTDAPPEIDRKHTYPELPTSWVSQLFETSDRRFWVATPAGLVEYFPDASGPDRFRAYAARNGLTDISLITVAEDLGGNLWLGSDYGGAMKIARGGFSTYGIEDGIAGVNAVFEDGAGSLCFKARIIGDARTTVFEGAKLDLLRGEHFTTHTRFGCFDGRRFDWFKPTAVSELGWIYTWVLEEVTLRSRRGEWWVGTSEGLYRFPRADHFSSIETARPLAVYTPKDGLAAGLVFRLFEDSRGDIWISTTSSATKGLARWERGSQQVRDLAGSPGLPSLVDDLPRSFGEDRDGQVWVGFNGGLVRHAGGAFTFFTPAHGLPAGAVVTIYVDRSNRIWLASDRGGLVRVDNATAKQPTFVTYTTASGLASNDTQVIAEDEAGYLYVGGGNGLDRLDPASGRVKHFGSADGLSPATLKAAFRDRHGVLWFGTSSGLARLIPAAEPPSAPPPVSVTGLRVRGVPQDVSALGERDFSLADLAPDQDQLQIDFVGLGFGPGEVLRYQYTLEGADRDWSVPSAQRSVTYARLAAGSYRFVVRAVSSEGVVSDRPAVVTFTIVPPVWQRWWALTLMVLTIGLVVHQLYRYRVARLLEIADMRTRIASDLHDDIGANLTRIALLSEVARLGGENRRRPEAADASGLPSLGADGGPLISIGRIARESVSSMSDIVWAVNPARDSLLDLTRRMRQHADEVFTARGITLRFRGPVDAEAVRLGADVRRDLLLIFKEAVNNAARHSRCSRVDVDLHLEDHRLILTVRDDGTGFDPSVESGGHGMASMRRRGDRLGGALEIRSGNPAGTTVTVTVPA